MDLFFGIVLGLKSLDLFVYYKHWSVEYCDVFPLLSGFFSYWRHPFTAEDPLVSKWCNAKFIQIKIKFIQTKIVSQFSFLG